jgi:predicted RNA-binding Zn ribbon-like protein
MDWNEPAPGDLALLQEFVNTADLSDGTDELAAWLRANDAADADEERVAAFREALWHVLVEHDDHEAIAALDEAARGATLMVTVGPGGSATLQPAVGGTDAVLARILAIMVRAQADGTWARMKACPADDCMAAFYDRSRNRSRTWCDMAACGNRAKARNYRARQR